MTYVTLVGRLGADPEMRFTQGGKSIASFSLVTSKSTKRPDGGWDESETTWYRVEVWEEFAENVVESLRKGMQVIVVGRQFMDTYTTKDGAERQTLKVAAYSIGPDLKRGVFQKVESTGARGSATPRPSDDPWSTPVQDDIPPF
jgi:single-strand DNA-binding protein